MYNWYQILKFHVQECGTEYITSITSSAGAEISDGPHKRGGLRRAGPNDFMFVYNSMQRDLSISILFVFVFCFVSHVFYFLHIEYNLHLVDGTVYYS